MHASLASERLAEVVASFLQTVKRRSLNQKMSTSKLVWATQLQLIGLQGMGGEDGLLIVALNIHLFMQRARVVCMFVPNTANISVSDDSAVIRREVRALRQAR